MLNAELNSMNSILTYESFLSGKKTQGKKTQVVVFLTSCCVSDSLLCFLISCCVSDSLLCFLIHSVFSD